MANSKAVFRRHGTLIALVIGGIIFSLILGGIYFFFFSGEAFKDRGTATSRLPIITESQNTFTRHLLPYHLENALGARNSEFIGPKLFMDAFLYGEQATTNPREFRPADSEALTLPLRPGVLALLKRPELDAYHDFHHWVFPLPSSSPTRGRSYTMLHGDWQAVVEEARLRGIDYSEYYLDALFTVMSIGKGWDLSTGKAGPVAAGSSADSEPARVPEHLVTRAWMATHCHLTYLEQSRDPKCGQFAAALRHLETFMKMEGIRYPANYTCLSTK